MMIYLIQTRRVFSTRRVGKNDRTSTSTRRVLSNPAGGVFDVQKIANQWNNEYRTPNTSL
jgi:hypothetical protein